MPKVLATEPPTEDEVRELRDKVYGPQTDKEWEQCKHNWMRPDSVEWLREKAKRVITV
jgi:hypothetical protein